MMGKEDGSAQVDLSKVPFAAWLESIIPQVCKQDAEAIGIVVLQKDGGAGTAYYNAEAAHKGKMAWWLLMDSMLDVVRARGDVVKDALDLEDTRNEGDCEEREDPGAL